MKEYILKFKDEAEACEKLIPKGFGYVSVKRGPILFDNSMGEFFIERISSSTGFVLKLQIIKEVSDELDTYLKGFEDNGQ